MHHLTEIQGKYLEVAMVFHFFTKEHLELWFTGKRGRSKRVERVLPALVKKGKLKYLEYGKRYVYATTDRFITYDGDTAINFYHGLQCTEILVRFALADNNIEVISERQCQSFRWGCAPEWVIKYPSGKSVLLEFCTEDNVRRGKVISKVNKYREVLPFIAHTLNTDPIVLFILDVKPSEVKELVTKVEGDEPFMFVDYDTFLSSHPLIAAIYLWSGDGKPYPLKNVQLESD